MKIIIEQTGGNTGFFAYHVHGDFFISEFGEKLYRRVKNLLFCPSGLLFT
jgi:hypothetical protein